LLRSAAGEKGRSWFMGADVPGVCALAPSMRVRRVCAG
jgi:hypothetical protein